jgi:uncharacterized protein (TIGR02391 family)
VSTASLEDLLSFRRQVEYASDAVDAHQQFQAWVEDGASWLESNGYPAHLRGAWEAVSRSPLVQGGGYHDYPEAWERFEVAIQRRLDWLADLLSRGGDTERHETSAGTWAAFELLHPEIREVARARLKAGHRADAVEAALKHVNAILKERVLKLTGKELDGADLMNVAFSPKNPVLLLGDLGTLSGRSMQQGYMQIFAGAMTGVRNPKAHAILDVDETRATHLLFLASLLRYKVDEVTDNPANQ